MKKAIVILVFVAIAGGTLYWVNSRRAPLSFLEGTIEKAVLGSLEVPITASGRIEPAGVTKIKSKASGEVEQIPFQEGRMVREGDLIILLDQENEQRQVERAETEYLRAMHAWERSKLVLTQQETAGIMLAEAKVAQAKARLEQSEFEYDRVLRLGEQVTQRELKFAKVSLDESRAAMKAAEAELTQARIAPQIAKVEIASSEQTMRSALKVKEEAEQRLRETTIRSPINGMILKQHIAVGEIAQSATGILGGNPLVDIADVSEIYAMVNVDEADIGLVRDLAPPSARPGPTAESQPATLPSDVLSLGQKVKIGVESFPEEEFFGVISRISPQAEVISAIATFKVAIRITSDNRFKLIGLLSTPAEATFTAKSVSNAVLVPYDAIFKDPNGDARGVYVPKEVPGKARREPVFQPCTLGVDNGLQVQVISGIEAGQEIYTKLPIKTRAQEKEDEKRKEAEE